jgi:environmental stress-induced protein Ves
MKGLHLFSEQQLKVSPWRNGGGETREVVSWPPAASDFDWRVSIATIASDGAFSLFPGVDRSISLLSGAGVLLSSPAGTAQAQRIHHRLAHIGQPFAFAGEQALNAQLLGTVTTDFNLMTCRQRVSGVVHAVAHHQQIDVADGGVLFVVRGSWQLAGEMTLEGGQGVWWSADQRAAESWQITAETPESLLLWASITSHNV